MIPLPLLMVLFYAMLDKDSIENGSVGITKEKEVQYKSTGSSPDSDDEETFAATDKPLCPLCSEKRHIASKILPFIAALCLSFFAEYMSISSVVTTIAFPNSKVSPRDHFLFYILSYGIGKFVGRSHLFIFAFLPSETMEYMKYPKTFCFAGE